MTDSPVGGGKNSGLPTGTPSRPDPRSSGEDGEDGEEDDGGGSGGRGDVVMDAVYSLVAIRLGPEDRHSINGSDPSPARADNRRNAKHNT
ncbi:hypothetical protein E1286_45630 [Nonomuraea terrae]|uniref:Uncharacterized protein n=1 Tax=Nonomuraea terrae TaxID=2530383 RepID=A0A4R4XJ34_9ACTN|nr:hypothetical protein [Nonomuraea terrae]TDD30916.1 hypothetical protein E1286_45630 [Nonomuraea terrae]